MGKIGIARSSATTARSAANAAAIQPDWKASSRKVAAERSMSVSTKGAVTLVGEQGRTRFKLVWDKSVAGAPPSFKAGLIQGAANIAKAFGTDIVVTIRVGWNERGGLPISQGLYASTVPQLRFYRYADVLQALRKVFPKAVPAMRAPLGVCALTQAQARALGLPPDKPDPFDASVGFSSADAGARDYIALAEHEFTKVMGRFSTLGNKQVLSTGATLERYPTILDLFRVHSTFRPLGGTGVVGFFNTDPAADLGDWAHGAFQPGDAFNAFLDLKAKNPMTDNDYYTMSALGYKLLSSDKRKT